jgi:rod shape-determining protein MreC
LIDFLRRNRILFASAIGLLLAAALVMRTSATPARSDPVGRLFLGIMAPFQRATSAVGGAVGGVWSGFTGLLRARSENDYLRARAQRLEQELDRLSEVSLENARLRRLLEFRQTLAGDVLTARVIGRDATGLARTLLIDRGLAQGVEKGAAVLAPEGVVGHVFLAGNTSARVLLVVDHNSGVDAVVQRTRAPGIVQGTVGAGCVLKYVKRTEDVQKGDAIVTSGVDGIFPKGLPIGEVTEVDKRGKGLFQSAEVTPRVDFDALEEVLVTRGAVARAEPATNPAE